MNIFQMLCKKHVFIKMEFKNKFFFFFFFYFHLKTNINCCHRLLLLMIPHRLLYKLVLQIKPCQKVVLPCYPVVLLAIPHHVSNGTGMAPYCKVAIVIPSYKVAHCVLMVSMFAAFQRKERERGRDFDFN